MFDKIVEEKGILTKNKMKELLNIALQTKEKTICVNDLVIHFTRYYIKKQYESFIIHLYYNKNEIVSCDNLCIQRINIRDIENSKYYDFTNTNAFRFKKYSFTKN